MIKRYVNTYWTIVDLICRKSQKISDFFYEGTINDEYEREHNVIHLKKSDMILHIGCGVYPYSAIVLSKNPHQKIVAIDNNDHAIQHAKHIISDHNLQKEIDIDKGDGGSYHLNSFSVIIVSSCVDLTKNVLDHIIKDAKPKTRIIIRELRPMSRYVKKYLKQRKSISFINQFSIYSFPFYSILGWDSFIIQKTS
jgi:protein-L-isoaspartate O-methyltransferase